MHPRDRSYRYVKLARLEVSLAIQSAIDEYGMQANSHAIWHKLKPWLAERKLEDVRYAIATLLLPECRRLRWDGIIPDLEQLYSSLCLDETWEIPGCMVCARGG